MRLRPDGIGTVLAEERERFEEIKERVRGLLLKQVTEFRFAFPFGRPEGSLKAALSLLERVLVKDMISPSGTRTSPSPSPVPIPFPPHSAALSLSRTRTRTRTPHLSSPRLAYACSCPRPRLASLPVYS